MNNLILDCSCGMNVYVVKDDNVFSYEDKTQNKHSDEILKIIDSLLEEAKVSIHEIDNICVCVGPGSFTGVRVAVSIAKGLATGNKAKVFALSNFDIFETNENNYVLILDGFSNLVYARKCVNGEISDSCVEIEKLVKEINDKKFIVYHTTEKTQNLFKKYEINSIMSKNNIIFAFNEKINKQENIALNQIYPVYLRASQAEIEREKKKNG